MRLYDLGKLSGQGSMLTFHALARLNIEALILVSPKEPIVSIGYFQEIDKVIDWEYCKSRGISVMRREIGGGATYLDENQIFYQVVLKRDNPMAPPSIMDRYVKFSKAPIEAYRRFGIEAQFRPINDIVTKEGRKIAGEGGGDIGDCIAFVGGILLDFDYDAMSKILRVPDEKFRDKVYKSIEENLTTMRRELGYTPDREKVKAVLAEEFEKVLGNLEPAELDDPILAKMKELEQEFMSDAHMYRKGRSPYARVKIAEGVEVFQGTYKARGGLITTTVEVKDGRIKDAVISGDFTFTPKDKLAELERYLIGSELSEDVLSKKIKHFYESNGVQSPGVACEEIAATLVSRPI
ncbi:MAG: lipoate--protein ligase [bacterium]